MRRRSRLSEAALVVCVMAATDTTAEAAVRVCKDAIATSASGGSETVAKKSALDQWKAGAAMIGPGYTSWRLAVEKILSCRRTAGETVCNLRGRPCTLRQVPTLPDNGGAY